MSRADMVLRNGRFFSEGAFCDGGMAIADGRIAALGANPFLPEGKREINLKGATFLPRGVDTPGAGCGHHFFPAGEE